MTPLEQLVASAIYVTIVPLRGRINLHWVSEHQPGGLHVEADTLEEAAIAAVEVEAAGCSDTLRPPIPDQSMEGGP